MILHRAVASCCCVVLLRRAVVSCCCVVLLPQAVAACCFHTLLRGAVATWCHVTPLGLEAAVACCCCVVRLPCALASGCCIMLLPGAVALQVLFHLPIECVGGVLLRLLTALGAVGATQMQRRDGCRHSLRRWECSSTQKGSPKTYQTTPNRFVSMEIERAQFLMRFGCDCAKSFSGRTQCTAQIGPNSLDSLNPD